LQGKREKELKKEIEIRRGWEAAVGGKVKVRNEDR
jgi:hypothetical protein